MQTSNIELLKLVARRLGPLLSEVVFVGGCTTGLFITDEAAAEVRPTFDVDVIAEITSYADYARFSERLQALGFVVDTSKGAPLCRWLIDDLKLDVMPIDEKILGFTNRWYAAAMKTSQIRELETGLSIRMVMAPYFVATKLEAFRGRGLDDYVASQDLEDIVAVMDGRPHIVGEIIAVSDVRDYIAEQFRNLLRRSEFLDALPGYLPADPTSQSRASLIETRMNSISSASRADMDSGE